LIGLSLKAKKRPRSPKIPSFDKKRPKRSRSQKKSRKGPSIRQVGLINKAKEGQLGLRLIAK